MSHETRRGKWGRRIKLGAVGFFWFLVYYSAAYFADAFGIRTQMQGSIVNGIIGFVGAALLVFASRWWLGRTKKFIPEKAAAQKTAGEMKDWSQSGAKIVLGSPRTAGGAGSQALSQESQAQPPSLPAPQTQPAAPQAPDSSPRALAFCTNCGDIKEMKNTAPLLLRGGAPALGGFCESCGFPLLLGVPQGNGRPEDTISFPAQIIAGGKTFEIEYDVTLREFFDKGKRTK